MESARLLTAGLVDYAGLFPPAKLAMAESVANYASYLDSEDAAMLGRFVVPANRLDDFGEAAKKYLRLTTGAGPWKLSVLLGDNFAAEIPAILKFNCSHWTDSPDGHVEIDAVEVKAADVAPMERLRATLPAFYRGFVEIPATETRPEIFAAIRRLGFSAKIRTGGVTASAFPPAQEIVQFMRRCHEHSIPFKATAGLHHVICASYPLTYEPGTARAPMFGFLNLFAAAAFLLGGANDDTVLAILQETDRRAFRFSDSGLAWRSKELTIQQIAKARSRFAISFGSCSFTEPVRELKALLSNQSSGTE